MAASDQRPATTLAPHPALSAHALWYQQPGALAGQPDGAYDTSVTGFGFGFGFYQNLGNVVVSFAEQPVVSAPGGPYKICGFADVDAPIDNNSGPKKCIESPPATVARQIKLPGHRGDVHVHLGQRQ
ncbi:hypothetical protein [Arthrobacter glacialis]|uniref:hypothetical protein n=1 Tax=Arthrobacter glacialis TaxID=1664 RepID=UPI000CD3F424|nr:hypothetical protein [Arthrobacter glacialis]POH60162.1 hypothetical protein CVS28_04245 [Arthrobacter glacialis]